jgi:nitrite reductase/ring-hydroxylating ferredoxin subunit
MDRKDFIRQCSWACVGLTLGGALLAGCGSHKGIIATRHGDHYVIPKSAFWSEESQRFRNYVIITNDELVFPICVFRKQDETFSALLMECSHQGAELQAFGDRLQCPAHGSEFNQDGVPLNAPADRKLRTFTCTTENDNLLISLR